MNSRVEVRNGNFNHFFICLFFDGFLKIVYSEQTQSWQVVNITNTDQVFASMNVTEGNDFPIGKHRWMFEGTDCSDDHRKDFRSLLLHRDVRQPGYFCCDDGTCLGTFQ